MPKVLLREPETCAECRGVFLSLYALRCCDDHEGLDELFKPARKKPEGGGDPV